MSESPETAVDAASAQPEKRRCALELTEGPIIPTPRYSGIVRLNPREAKHLTAALDHILELMDDPSIQAKLREKGPRRASDNYTFAPEAEAGGKPTAKNLLAEYKEGWERNDFSHGRAHQDILQILQQVGKENLGTKETANTDPFRELMNLSRLALGRIQHGMTPSAHHGK